MGVVQGVFLKKYAKRKSKLGLFTGPSYLHNHITVYYVIWKMIREDGGSVGGWPVVVLRGCSVGGAVNGATVHKMGRDTVRGICILVLIRYQK